MLSIVTLSNLFFSGITDILLMKESGLRFFSNITTYKVVES